MLSHEFSHVPSLPHHTHVIELAKRAKATLGGAEASEASQVGEASEASEPTCIKYYTWLVFASLSLFHTTYLNITGAKDRCTVEVDRCQQGNCKIEDWYSEANMVGWICCDRCEMVLC